MKTLICLFLSISLIFINFSFAQNQEKTIEPGTKSEVGNLEKQEPEVKPTVKIKKKKPSWKAQFTQEPKKKRKALIPIIIGVIVVGGIVGYLLLKKSDEEAIMTYQGTVSDPVGDSEELVAGLTHDLVSAKIEIRGPDATFEVHYASGSFHETLTRAQFLLDIDQNPSTGYPGINAGSADDNIIGVEYLINMGPRGSDYGTFVLAYSDSEDKFNQIGTYSVTKLSDGFRVSIPLPVFGGDDGMMNFKVTSSAQFSIDSSASPGLIDKMPNIGLPAGEVK